MDYYYVYCLIDPRNSQVFYVGKGIGNRMMDHYYKRKNHYNEELGQLINDIVNSGNTIVYEKILYNINEEEAFNKEMELIHHYGRQDLGTGILLNKTSGGEGVGGWSDDRRETKRQQELSKQKGKPVSQYDLEGKHMQDFPSAKVASEKVPTSNRSYITQCCKGRRLSSGGFAWAYKGDPSPKKYTKQYYKPVKQLTTKGKLIAEFRSLTEAQNATGVELHNISECCRGKSKTAGSFVWRYK